MKLRNKILGHREQCNPYRAGIIDTLHPAWKLPHFSDRSLPPCSVQIQFSWGYWVVLPLSPCLWAWRWAVCSPFPLLLPDSCWKPPVWISCHQMKPPSVLIAASCTDGTALTPSGLGSQFPVTRGAKVTPVLTCGYFNRHMNDPFNNLALNFLIQWSYPCPVLTISSQDLALPITIPLWPLRPSFQLTPTYFPLLQAHDLSAPPTHWSCAFPLPLTHTRALCPLTHLECWAPSFSSFSCINSRLACALLCCTGLAKWQSWWNPTPPTPPRHPWSWTGLVKNQQHPL